MIRDRVSAAVCIIFAAYMGYLAHSDGVALAPSIFYGIAAFVLLAVILMVLRSFVYALIIAALVVWVAHRMGYGWADQIVNYVEQLLELGYRESLKLFLSAEKPITT
ncbi:hypothetical protein EDC90_100319 [Martelella mediterranea]|uniref:Uncharacterized protein n=2 Tax=Martelella mediterranea TaxID=293089 RepID=A0A4V2V4T4_9HYPH|nr:hypothetical protein EDC90_100319 [Martelella mediterranea]